MDAMSRRKSMRRTMTVAPRTLLDAKPQQDAQQPEVPNVVLSELVASNFKPEDYLKRTLKTVPEKNIRQFRKALEDSRKLTARNLQKNVYRNYESFVFISKEISGMERDMQLLRELLHNISQVGDDLIEEETEENLGRRRTMRMSMANQQDMFKDQLTKVWRSIQDAQRFVPFAPNRHVIGEIKGIGELSPSTLATRQKIDVVVLNDILLLAVRRKRGNHSQAMSVADRAFNMADVSVEDLGDSPRMANLVKIVNRAETLIFAFARVEAKKEFVMMIDHAKSTLFSLDAMAVPPMPPIRGVPTRSVKSGVSTQLGSIVEDETDARGASNKARFDEMLDALDIHIARREFEESTALVLDLKQHLEAAPNKGPESVREAVEAHIAELARLILADLLIPCSPRKQVSANVELLHRLGWDKEAKEAFLASRSATIKNRTRQLKLEGNTRLYIRELAVVYFRLIRNTCEWYSEFFLDPTMISALIAWVRQEMAGYAAIFRRHVFHEMQKFQIIASCLKHTLVEVEILGHAGLDLKFMLDQEFFPDLTGCIRSYETRCIAMLGKAVNEDSLAIASKITASTEELVKMFGNQIPIIAAVSKLDEVLGDFGNELRYIVRDSLYGQSVASVTAIIEGVLKHLLTALRRSNLTYAQEFALLASTQAIVSWVIPRSATQLDRVFGRTVTDIHNLEQRLEAFPASLQDVFCQKQSVAIARATFDFVTTDFNDDNEVTDNMTPSQEMEKLLLTLGVVARELDSWPAMPKRSILSGIIDCLFVQMIEPRNWETSKGEKRRFSHFGVHRLVLDIHFLLRVCGSLVSKGTNDMANRVCEKGLRAYFAANRSKGAEMKNRPWYDARVMETMQRLGFGFPQFGKGFEHRAQQSFEGASPANSAAASRGNSASPATPVSVASGQFSRTQSHQSTADTASQR